MIRNINEKWGMPEEFECVSEMEECILACGYELPEEGLKEGIDYESFVEANDPMMDFD